MAQKLINKMKDDLDRLDVRRKQAIAELDRKEQSFTKSQEKMRNDLADILSNIAEEVRSGNKTITNN